MDNEIKPLDCLSEDDGWIKLNSGYSIRLLEGYLFVMYIEHSQREGYSVDIRCGKDYQFSWADVGEIEKVADRIAREMVDEYEGRLIVPCCEECGAVLTTRESKGDLAICNFCLGQSR